MKELDELFDQQVRTLLDKDYPEAVGVEEDQFSHRIIDPLREKIHQVGEVNEDHIPFLIVIPEQLVSLPKQMSLAKVYYDSPNFGFLRNATGVKVPNRAYLICNVEIGIATINISPNNCIKRFKETGHLGLTAAEGIALVTHYPERLRNHYSNLGINLVGSRDSSGYVPALWFTPNKVLAIDFKFASHYHWRWGAPSCGSRIC